MTRATKLPDRPARTATGASKRLAGRSSPRSWYPTVSLLMRTFRLIDVAIHDDGRAIVLVDHDGIIDRFHRLPELLEWIHCQTGEEPVVPGDVAARKLFEDLRATAAAADNAR